MEDLERYGDYNEYEDDAPKGKNKVVLLLKILIAAVCITVIGLFAFRMIMFNYYPDSMDKLYFNDTLTAFYNKTEGDIDAKTKAIQYPYDNEKGTTFYAGNFFYVGGAQQVQFSLRYNKTLSSEIEKKWGVTLSDNLAESFTFVLYRNNPNFVKGEDPDSEMFVPIGTLDAVVTDTSMTYNYFKLVFDGVDLDADTLGAVDWLSVAIYVNGTESDADPYRIAVYERGSSSTLFKDYELSGEEKPSDN
ncbi:MAG: hypothetical protein IJD51_03480 [Clostridia bacterium]|nr:hypothetical protein [Clostridia bacterium]